jgi:pilus assembly protein Flp/PilA
MAKRGPFAQDQSGVTAIEYCLIAAAVGLVIFAVMPGMKGPLGLFYESLSEGLNTVASAPSQNP